MNYFQFEASLDGVSYLADGGVSLRFSTKELGAEDRVKVSYFHRHYGWVCFKENEFKEDEIPTGDAEDEERSPSQRLRAVLYILWKQKASKLPFEQFYRNQIDAAISRVRKLLD